MGVIREFDGSDRFDIGILGFYDFYLVFIYDVFINSCFWSFKTLYNPLFFSISGISYVCSIRGVNVDNAT